MAPLIETRVSQNSIPQSVSSVTCRLFTYSDSPHRTGLRPPLSTMDNLSDPPEAVELLRVAPLCFRFITLCVLSPMKWWKDFTRSLLLQRSPYSCGPLHQDAVGSSTGYGACLGACNLGPLTSGNLHHYKGALPFPRRTHRFSQSPSRRPLS